MTDSTPVNPAFECLSALSVILDLANGLAEDKSVLAATFAWELAQDAGFSEDEQWAALLAAMLRHLGCTAYASVEAEVAGDDIALRGGLHRRDASRALDVMASVAGAGRGVFEKSRGVVQLAAKGSRLEAELTTEACGAARLLSEGLKLGPKVTRALDEVFERYDGKGTPHGWDGAALSNAGRAATVAHVATVFALEGGALRATGVLRARAGTALDPALAKRAEALVGRLDAPSEYLGQQHDALERFAAKQSLPTTLDDVAEAFGDFSDLQAPHARGHSREVAAWCRQVATLLHLPADEVSTLSRAAHLHDLGQVAVPTSIWTMARVHRPTERERARAHAFFTERVLSAAAPLSAVAKVAGAHHERLDGSGYHRGSTGGAVSRSARILAACDVASALLKDRPHRPAMTSAGAVVELRAMVKSGQLDGEVVEAVLSAMGERSAKSRPASALSERELEVLRLVARGKTNKEVAASLGLSARTVQHHTIHIYEKLGVDTRAGAAMVASQRGLLE